MPTTYNKVVAGNQTLIDLSQDTVTSSDHIMAGYVGHLADGTQVTGTGQGGGNAAITIVDTLDSSGGTIRTITAVDLDDITKTSSDLTANGATVTAPAGYYASDATKSVASGSVTAPGTISGSSASVSAGTDTITLTKTVSVTPNVTTAGYISSGTAGDASVSLTASVNTRTSSDLTANGATVTAPAGYYASDATKSVDSMTLPTSAAASATSGYSSKATISRSTSDQYINIPTGYNASGAYYKVNAVANGTEGTPTATKGTVSNHSVTVTPSVTNSAGYISGGTKTGTAVTVSASELVSGSETKTANGTYDVTNLAELVVNVSGGGSSKAVYTYTGLATRTANSYGATSAKVTVTKAGTYNISFVAIRGSSSGTMGTNLYIGSTGKGQNTTWNKGTYGQYVSYTNQTIAANTDVTIYATSGNNSRTIYVGQLIVEEV